MLIIDKETKKNIGFLSEIDEVKDVGLKFRLRPFVEKFGFLVYESSDGIFRVIHPKKCLLREVFIEC